MYMFALLPLCSVVYHIVWLACIKVSFPSSRVVVPIHYVYNLYVPIQHMVHHCLVMHDTIITLEHCLTVTEQKQGKNKSSQKWPTVATY